MEDAMDIVSVTISLPSHHVAPDEYQRILSLAVGRFAVNGNQVAATAVAGLLMALAGASPTRPL